MTMVDTAQAEYMDEVLPCGHRVPLFEAKSGKLVPIAISGRRSSEAFVDMPPVVWCVEVGRPSCGWVAVDPQAFERITANGHA